VIGIALGLLSGYAGGPVDEVVMRVVDVELSIPSVLMALTVVTILGPRVTTVILVLVVYGWVVYARLTRGQVLSLRERDFVLALRGLGASSLRIAVRHVLPNAAIPLIVLSTLELPNLIIIEASLGYLGLGIPPPTPTWGSMISDGQKLLTTGIWWPTAVPGLAIALLILSVNILGDWLRDRLDPRAGLRG
jgi:peptide/nickel transport system permease protein